MLKKIALKALSILAMSFPAPSYATFYCTAPSEPFCLRMSYTYDNEHSFDSCRRSMLNYQEDVVDYQQCLEEEYQRALEELEEAIEHWNCRASGKSFCF